MSDIVTRVTGSIGETRFKELIAHAERLKLPVSRLVTIALEHEFESAKPFIFECEIPDDEYVEYAYLQQAGQILTFMRKNGGMPLDLLVMLRHDMSIPDKNIFLLAFRECRIKGMVETYKPKRNMNAHIEYEEDYVFYRVKQDSPNKTKRKRATEYELLQKLKAKFGEK